MQHFLLVLALILLLHVIAGLLRIVRGPSPADRMVAPDIALAEAAIGTGITGVLLMDAVRHMESKPEAWQEQWLKPKRSLLGKGEKALPTLAAVAMAVLLLAGVARLSPADPAMAWRVSEQM